MEGENESLKTALVTPGALDSEGSWDSVLFVRSRVSSLLMAGNHRPLHHFADIFEGLRSFLEPAGTGGELQYRTSSIASFELIPTPQQWGSSSNNAKAAVHPGDVVLQRLAPVTAAIVPPGLPSQPADANFLIVRGLNEPQAWWLTYSFNYPACGDYLISKSGRGILSRVSLSVLRNWPVQPPPADFSRLARKLSELHQKRTFLAGRIAALTAEVESVVAGQMATTPYEETELQFAQPSWTFFFPAALADTSWLPAHVASEYRAAVLRRDSEWQPLLAYLLPESLSRSRFSKLDDPIPVLRLSDVGNVPVLPASLKPSTPAQATRVFRVPIQAEDVLLSMLGSSPRVAFAPFVPDPPVYAVDHWERLRFRAHSAAFALILQTGAVTRQLRSLATGSVQQFVRPEDIQSLFLPVLPEETLADWDRSFRSLCKSWHQTDSDWQAALQEGWQAFSRAYDLHLLEPSTRTQ